MEGSWGEGAGWGVGVCTVDPPGSLSIPGELMTGLHAACRQGWQCVQMPMVIASTGRKSAQ